MNHLLYQRDVLFNNQCINKLNLVKNYSMCRDWVVEGKV